MNLARETWSSKPIVIGGFYRSGTTLLRRILDGHSRIHCGPEVKFLKDFHGDYLEDPLAHARFFRTARSYGIPESALLAIFGSGFVALHEQAARAAGKRRWADKNPENVLFLSDWETILPSGFLFINVVRNPLDSLASLQEIGFHKTLPSSFESRVEWYARFRESAARYMQFHPETSLEVSYERLVHDPVATMRRVMERIGEDFEPGMLVGLNGAARGSGVEDPKAAGQYSVHAKSLGRGKFDLPEEAQAIVREKLGQYIMSPVEDS